MISGAQLGVLMGSLIAWLVVWCLLYRSRIGLGLRALAQDYWMAQASRSILQTYGSLGLGLSATLAALGGILLAPLSLVHSELGWLSIKAFAAAVLFGFGNVTGAVFGGLLLGITEQLSAAWFPDISRDLVSYLILLFWLWLRGSSRIGSAAIMFLGKIVKRLGSFIGFACLLTIPWWASSFWLSEAQTWLTYTLAGLSLKLLSKEVGLISLGHSAWLAIGAYGSALTLQVGGAWWLSY